MSRWEELSDGFRGLCIKFSIFHREVPNPEWLDPVSKWVVEKVNNPRDQVKVMEHLVTLIKSGNPIRDKGDAIMKIEKFLKGH
jgi:hypothetical protein